MAKKALLILAEGAEEMEAVIAADVLRRAGVDVNIAGLTGASPVKCSRNVVVVPDMSLEDATLQAPYDVIVLPGGLKGAESLAALFTTIHFTGDYKYCEDRVVIDGQLITSRGPGTAFEFALAIVEKLENKAAAEKLIPPMLVKV
ncbi:hypothetical protein HPB49_025183 [Dermacentor silvarum]|uniref:Uncharacterized protein n=1 Tax=Dermacentor silvarum TaxID=543639 RepID=A0ACB8D999_DERSI|nr:hypothetical protein HPB49_025183 [Dermacentor silvarum]